MNEYEKMGIPPELAMEIVSKMREEQRAEQLKKLKNIKKLNAGAKKKGIVFAGDSITEGYPLSEMFPRTSPIYNRGIGGITSKWLLENLDAHVLDLEPSKAFLLIGTNDLGDGLEAEEIAENIGLICEKLAAALPDAEAYLISVYPVDKDMLLNHASIVPSKRTNENILKLNELISAKAELYSNVKYLDIYSRLEDKGKIKPEYTVDGLHLSVEGYIETTQALKPYVLE